MRRTCLGQTPGYESQVSAAELPFAVRARVIALADETLAVLAEEDVPASLRAVRRFTPAKRARLGAASLGAALETEPTFRQAVVERVREGLPALATALDEGTAVPGVAAVDAAAVAYLLDSADWRARVEQLQDSRPDARAAGLDRDDGDRASRRHAKAEAARSNAREEAARLRGEAVALRRDAEDLRRRLSKAEATARRSEQAHAAAEARLEEALVSRVALERELSAEVRRLRTRLRDAEASAVAARRGTRSERDTRTARLRVLLETVTAASAGLRRELDLPPVSTRPADLVATELGSDEPEDLSGLLAGLRRGRSGDDPALVDEVLAVPGVHVIIDGYNVTKLGYGSLTLEDQRSRLVSGLAGIAARTPGAELTCVFDATAATARPLALGAPRGVRVLFSAAGELADQLIVRLAEAEPPGRPVVVVTNDREVAEAVRRAGGEALPSGALLGRLERL